MATTIEQQFEKIQEFVFDSLIPKDIKYIEQFIKEWKSTRKANSNRKVDAGTAAYRNLTEDEKNEFIENEFSDKDKYPEDKYKNVYLAFRKYYKDTHTEDNLIDNDTQKAINNAEKLLDNDSDSDSKVKSKPSKTQKSSEKKSLKKKKGTKKSKKVTNTTLSVSDIESESESDEETKIVNTKKCIIDSDESDSDSD